MSLCYDLYDTASNNPYVNEWDKDRSLPIAPAAEVQRRIMRLYPQIAGWRRDENTFTSPQFDYPVSYSDLGSGTCSPDEEYLDITLLENRDGFIHFISARSASPELLRALLEEFGLKYVFEGQSCNLIDPYQYDERWMPLAHPD